MAPGKSNELQAILFDMDGVLVDVSQSYRLAIKKTAEFFVHQPVTMNEIAALKNQGGYNNDWDLTMAIIRQHGVDADREKVVDRFQTFYVGKHFDGLIRNEKWLLKKNNLELLQKNFTLGIVTGRPKAEAVYVIRRNGVESFFPVLVCMEDTPKGKPDPAGILLAMEQLQIIRAVYLGDTVDDMKAATAAGIRGIGVSSSPDEPDRQRLVEHGAVAVIRNVNDIVSWLSLTHTT